MTMIIVKYHVIQYQLATKIWFVNNLYNKPIQLHLTNQIVESLHCVGGKPKTQNTTTNDIAYIMVEINATNEIKVTVT